jgi:peptide chain release factor 1
MLDKLNIVKQRFNEVSDLIIQPNIMSDQKRYISLNKEYKDLGLIVEKKKLYEQLLSNINEAKEICKNEADKEMIEMATDQLNEANEKISNLEEEIKFLLIPKDPDDSKNVVIE